VTTGLIIAAALLACLLWRENAMQKERQAWTRERGVLLNRIKPETAQSMDAPSDTDDPQPAAWDASDQWWEQLEEVR
jgi:hypothetical protein